MDAQTIRTLEFHRIQDILKRYALSALGEAEIDALAVETDPPEVRRLLSAAAEASALIGERGRPSGEGAADLRPLLNRAAAEGACLGTEDLTAVLAMARAGSRIKRFVEGAAGTYPLLREQAGRIDRLRELRRAIEAVVDERGGIRDSASERLAKIRERIRRQKERIKERLEEILGSEAMAPVVQERLITLRNDRYVIPLKPDFASRMEGIIHDHSASRVTVFVEPSETVEMNNRLSHLLSEEGEEIRRILLEMTGRVRAASGTLRTNQEAFADLDLNLAKALFARDFRAVPPGIVEQPRIAFLQARHPLLQDKEGPEPVAVDLRIGEGYRTLIITGPNAGGKTVALKTLGLLVLMAQAGVPIPVAEGSVLGVSREVFADIGDEQSIQENLSTFSGHIRNIVRILKEAGPDSLVLLDELGTGTDPGEGAALGLAVLEELNRRGSLTAATTHYEEIKQAAYATEGMQNASVAFDARRLEPAYLLEYGQLGRSHAFEISERMGVPAELLEAARARVPEGERSVARLIEELEGRIREQERRLRALALREEEAARVLEAREQEREEVLAEARALLAELREDAARTKKRARRLLRIAEQGKGKELEQEIREMDRDLRSRHPELAETPAVSGSEIPGPGGSVEIAGTGEKGVVLTAPDKRRRVRVLCNGLRLTVSLDRLKPCAVPVPSRAPRVSVGAELATGGEVDSSINLVGLRAEEARERTERYLDQAHLGRRRSVRIIHGIGSGALREVVAETLKAHPLVADFRPADLREGGAGVTLVELV